MQLAYNYAADVARTSPDTVNPEQLMAAAPVAILFFLGFFALIVGIMVLKGFALWRAARNGHRGWFIAMLVVNLMGILEVIYLLSAGKTVPPPGPVATPAPVVPKSPVPPMA